MQRKEFFFIIFGDWSLLRSALKKKMSTIRTPYEEELMSEAKTLAASLNRFESLLKLKYTNEAAMAPAVIVKKEKNAPPVIDEVESFVYDMLSVPLCKLTKIIVPNVQRKIDEIVYADEKNMTVCIEEHGADLNDDEGNCHELKVSTCKKSTNYKCNFNWPMPAGKDEETRRKRLLESVIEKTKGNTADNLNKIIVSEIETETDDVKRPYHGGDFKMISKDARGQVVLNEYSISGIFVYHYFKRLPEFSKSTVYNFGCERCAVCKEYHRLNNMKKYDDKMLRKMILHAKESADGKVAWKSEKEEDEKMDEWIPWNKIFTIIKSQCKG